MQKNLLLVNIALFLVSKIFSQDFISEKKQSGTFPLVSSVQPAPIFVDDHDDWLVHKAAALFQSDIERVTGKRNGIISTLTPSVKNIIIIGTINKSSLIKRLIAHNKLSIAGIKYKWDAF